MNGWNLSRVTKIIVNIILFMQKCSFMFISIYLYNTGKPNVKRAHFSEQQVRGNQCPFPERRNTRERPTGNTGPQLEPFQNKRSCSNRWRPSGTVNLYTSTFNLYTPTFNHYTPTVNLYTSTFNLNTPTVNLYTPTFNLYTPTFNHYTPNVNLYTPTINLYTLTFKLYNSILRPSTFTLRPSNFTLRQDIYAIILRFLEHPDLILLVFLWSVLVNLVFTSLFWR